MDKIIIYTDGGSRGNPGPAGIGVVIETQSGIKEYSKSIGKATNNEAEYQAIIFAMKKVKQLVGKDKTQKSELEIKSDSELIVSQLNGEFKIKEDDLIPFFIEIWNLKQDFAKVNFTNIPREQNKRADKLLNNELDSQSGLFG